MRAIFALAILVACGDAETTDAVADQPPGPPPAADGPPGPPSMDSLENAVDAAMEDMGAAAVDGALEEAAEVVDEMMNEACDQLRAEMETQVDTLLAQMEAAGTTAMAMPDRATLMEPLMGPLRDAGCD